MKAKDAFILGAGHQLATKTMSLGPLTTYSLLTDPKHMSFVLARYKFVAKMLEGKRSALEVGAGDGFGLPIVAGAVGSVHCIDWEPQLVESNRERLKTLENVTFQVHDITQKPVGGRDYDAIYSIDVLEHLDPESEAHYMSHLVESLHPKGVFITGTPNFTAAQHASEQSRVQHINLKTMYQLKELHERYFDYVFMFGQNDEVVHTGYSPMCHYLWAVCGGVK